MNPSWWPCFFFLRLWSRWLHAFRNKTNTHTGFYSSWTLQRAQNFGIWMNIKRVLRCTKNVVINFRPKWSIFENYPIFRPKCSIFEIMDQFSKNQKLSKTHHDDNFQFLSIRDKAEKYIFTKNKYMYWLLFELNSSKNPKFWHLDEN